MGGINFARLVWQPAQSRTKLSPCGAYGLVAGGSDMGVQRVIDGVHIVPMGMANAYLIEGDDGLTLIDAGFPNKEGTVFEAIRRLGRSPGQLKNLIFTHGHPESYRQRQRRRAGNRCEDIHAPARHPDVREWRSFSAYDSGTRPIAASYVQAVLSSRRASCAGCDRPAFESWGNIVDRRRHRSHPCSRALCRTGRTIVAPRIHAVRRRCVHEPHGPRRSRGLRRFG